MPRFFKALWGMEGLPLADSLVRLREAGYEGIEAPLDGIEAARKLDPSVPAIPMLFEEEIDSFRRGLDRAGALNPVSVTVHAGRDAWSDDEAARFYEAALPVVAESGLTVYFETHRGRTLYEPRTTAVLLNRFPELRLCADFSHWTCVTGTMLESREEELALALSRTGHLHARIGHEEGPQVPDPRAPMWTRHAERFFSIWDRLHAADPDLTVTPEYGPPNYQWTDPATGAPLADLWDVCLWTRDQLAARWA